LSILIITGQNINGRDYMDIKNINDSIVFSDKTLTKRVLFADKQILSFVLNLKAGQVLPAHRHENSSLVMLVLDGSGEIRINAERQRLEKGTVVLAKGEDDFEIPNVSKDISILVNISPNPSNELYSKEV
jgi:quercetin dioxygenase-like cupin family protein